MKRIAVVTATRAEYGLLSPVIRSLRKRESDAFSAELIVTGTHLSEKYGNTIKEIEADGIRIDHTVSISVDSASEQNISCNQAEALVKFTELFINRKYDAVMLLGDRYETLSIAIAAANTRTPIFHLCGGDTTEGAQDEWIRHAITKMSYLHFVTNEDSRKRVIQLGENPERVFNFGSTSVDNAMSAADMTKQLALGSLGLADCRYALCTYHPVTMEDGTSDDQIANFLEAIGRFRDIQFIVTKSNADQGGARINVLLDEAAQRMENLHVFASLGVKRYLSLMKSAEFVLGNSSSGVIETPIFRIPTINIGDRQRGRLQSDSVINCAEDADAIEAAIHLALSDVHREICQSVVSPYGDGHAAERIAQKAFDCLMDGRIDLKKRFYSVY